MTTEAKQRRLMTDDEREFAVALGACRFVPGTVTKRFAQDMARLAETPDSQITEKQAAFLRRAIHTFRRQINPRLVALAETQLRLTALAEAARRNAGLSA